MGNPILHLSIKIIQTPEVLLSRWTDSIKMASGGILTIPIKKQKDRTQTLPKNLVQLLVAKNQQGVLSPLIGIRIIT